MITVKAEPSAANEKPSAADAGDQVVDPGLSQAEPANMLSFEDFAGPLRSAGGPMQYLLGF